MCVMIIKYVTFATFKVLTAVLLKITVVWVTLLPCYLSRILALRITLQLEAACATGMFVPICQSIRRHIPENWNYFCFVKVIYRMSNKGVAAARNFHFPFCLIAVSNEMLVQVKKV
jgi:hypothetical protein